MSADLGQVGYKPILIESDSARQELMNNLQLDTESNTDSNSIGSECNLLEAFDNLWASIEDKKGDTNYTILLLIHSGSPRQCKYCRVSLIRIPRNRQNLFVFTG